MLNRIMPSLALLSLLAGALPAHAVDDFNSSRSNREKGTLASPPEAPPVAQEAQDFNTTRSNKDRRGLTVHGDPHVDQITIDEGGVHRSSTSRVLPTVNKRSTACPSSNASAQRMAINTKGTGATRRDAAPSTCDGRDNDCDGAATALPPDAACDASVDVDRCEAGDATACPAAAPVRSPQKTRTGHVTVLK